MNIENFQIWLIIAKLDMALVIKALLASECAAKIYICIIVMPIKLIYFLYGWQPESLIRFALWVRQLLLAYNAEFGHLEINQKNSPILTNYSLTNLLRNDSFYIEYNKTWKLNTAEETSGHYENSSKNARMLELRMSEEDNENKFTYDITAVCAFPNSLDFLGNYTLATFSMITTIIR